MTHRDTILAALKFAALKHEAFWALGAPDDRPSESLQRLKDAIAAVEAWQEIVTNGEKLLPCPFCGTEPSIEADGLGGTIIACDNDDCPVVVEYTHHVSALEAAQDWNRRAYLVLPSAQPIPIPDNPDDDPLGLHAQRWVRVDRITLVCLKAVLRGDASAPLRPFVEMLARRMEEALSTPQEQDVVAMPQVDEITPIITRWTELMLALVEDLKDSQQPEGADALRDEARTVTRWLTLQRRPGKGE